MLTHETGAFIITVNADDPRFYAVPHVKITEFLGYLGCLSGSRLAGDQDKERLSRILTRREPNHALFYRFANRAFFLRADAAVTDKIRLPVADLFKDEPVFRKRHETAGTTIVTRIPAVTQLIPRAGQDPSGMKYRTQGFELPG